MQPRMLRKEHRVCPGSETNSTALRVSQSSGIRDLSAAMHDLLRAPEGSCEDSHAYTLMSGVLKLAREPYQRHIFPKGFLFNRGGWAENKGRINDGINGGIKSRDQRVAARSARRTLGALVMSREPNARGPMGQVHCQRNSMTMTIAGRWPKNDGGIGGVRGGRWDGRSSLARFLGSVPKRGFVLASTAYVRY